MSVVRLEDVRDTVVKCGAISTLIDTMKAHRNVPNVQLTCLWCFINLFFTSETNKRLFGEANGVEVVVKALNTHIDNVAIVKAAAICLLQLARLGLSLSFSHSRPCV
jgi:hypothetical protein